MRAPVLFLVSTAVGCMSPSRDPIQHVFLTSGDYDGNLVAIAGDPTLDGPAAADLLCNQAAAEAGLAGKWTAWISVGDGSNLDDPTAPGYLKAYSHASYRVAAIDRIVGDGPWFNRSIDKVNSAESSEAMLFADRTALVTGATGDIFYNEYGQLPEGISGVTSWTGTRTDGKPTSWDCAGWTTNTTANLGVAGAEYDSSDLFDIGPTWTDDANLSCGLYDESRCPGAGVTNRDAHGWGAIECSTSAKLYCFENTPS